MTVIVSVKINDGIVMASDSASTFGVGQNYLHADKIVNLVKGRPIGAMVTGAGGIGNESISTLLKDLRSRLDGSSEHPWTLGPAYTMEEVVGRAREFLFAEKAHQQDGAVSMKIRFCGYSAGRSLPEVWELNLDHLVDNAPILIQPEDDWGPRWDGEYEPLNRMILGYSVGIRPALEQSALAIPDNVVALIRDNAESLFALPSMPIQDAIDLGRWMVELTMGFQRFNVLKQPKTVGGSIEIAAITKHEGFRWIQRRHFYPATLNP